MRPQEERTAQIHYNGKVIGGKFTVLKEVSYVTDFNKTPMGDEAMEVEVVETTKDNNLIVRMGFFKKDSPTLTQNRSTKLATLREEFHLFRSAQDAIAFIKSHEIPKSSDVLYGLKKWEEERNLSARYEIVSL
jgi:hypothetical protein